MDTLVPQKVKISQYTDIGNKRHEVSHMVVPSADSTDKEKLVNELIHALSRKRNTHWLGNCQSR